MKNLLLFTVLAVTVSFGFNHASFAVCGEGPPDTFTCDTNPPNPDLDGIQQGSNINNLTVNVLPGAGVDTFTPGNADNGIETGNGNDTVTVTDGEVIGGSDGIDTGSGEDVIRIIRSLLSSPEGPCINSFNQDDFIEIVDSEVNCFTTALASGNQSDELNITGSTLTSENGSIIFAGNQDDEATIVNSILNPGNDTAVAMQSDNDRVNLGTGAEINGLIDCGSGTDTVAFQMEVPEESLAFLSGEIAQLEPGVVQSITINELVYDLEDCEIFLNELVGVRVTRPIPTLSEWGLIALVVAIGAFGVFFALRRRAAVDS